MFFVRFFFSHETPQIRQNGQQKYHCVIWQVLLLMYTVFELILIEIMNDVYNQYIEQIELCTLNIFCMDLIEFIAELFYICFNLDLSSFSYTIL